MLAFLYHISRSSLASSGCRAVPYVDSNQLLAEPVADSNYSPRELPLKFMGHLYTSPPNYLLYRYRGTNTTVEPSETVVLSNDVCSRRFRRGIKVRATFVALFA